jgi:hypothetical protein
MALDKTNRIFDGMVGNITRLDEMADEWFENAVASTRK